MQIVRNFGTLVVFLALLAGSLSAFPVRAETATLRIGATPHPAGSVVVSTTTMAQYTVPQSQTKIGIFEMTFSLTAFGNNVTVPTDVRRMHATDTSTSTVGFVVENKHGEVVDQGIAVASLISDDASSTSGLHTIPKDKTHSFTFLAAFAGTNLPDDGYRVRVTNFPMTIGTSTKPLLLSTGELSHLLTKFFYFD